MERLSDAESEMEESDNEILTGFIRTLSRPEETLLPLFLSGQNATASRKHLHATCQFLFKEIERLSKTYYSLTQRKGEASLEPLSGLDQLYTGTDDHPVDAETIWGQVEIQNAALLPLVKKSLKHVVKSVEGQKDEVRLLDLGGVMSEDENDEGGEESDMDDGSDKERSREGESDDAETRRMHERMERAMADMDESESENESETEKRVTDDQVDEEELLEDPAAAELNNGFFDILEMEAFADEEEDYLPNQAFGTVRPEKKEKKKSFHQRQREGDIDSDGESDDEENVFGEREGEPFIRRRKYREDDEIQQLRKIYEKPQSDDDGDSVVNMTATDFFGKPDKKYFHKWEAKKDFPSLNNEDNDDAESWDDHDFERDAPGWRDDHADEEGIEEEEEAQSKEDEVAGEEAYNSAADDKAAHSKKATDTKQSVMILQQTEQLEKEMLAEKPWQMTGETKSMSRPLNSLLQATPEFEVATKMAPLVTIEHTTNLEDVIKRRILAEDWDDVVPRELPDISWNKKRSELPEVSQEKSKLGLGELYEREYLKKAVGYDVDAAEKQTEEEKAKNEMKALFANLCSKLDALSNYHFAPRPISEEAEVRPVTTPAIAMEEVMPLHVSDARGVAPEEVYGKKRGRNGVMRGESELDQAERKRLRGAKKAARRKQRAAKLADEKLISRLQPGLGLNNPYEKRKAREELSMAKAQGKITTGDVDANADYGASSKFFKRMQEEVEESVKGDTSKRKRKTDNRTHGQKSSAFKL